MPVDQQVKIFEPTADDQSKVIVATNIAETSLTGTSTSLMFCNSIYKCFSVSVWQGFTNPPGYGRRVSEGMGTGTYSCTLDKPATRMEGWWVSTGIYIYSQTLSSNLHSMGSAHRATFTFLCMFLWGSSRAHALANRHMTVLSTMSLGLLKC
jgi:hypothetical protein